MTDSEQREIADELQKIRQRLELLSAPLEEILTNRIVQHTKKQVTLWLGTYFVAGIAALGWFGIGIPKLIDAASDQVKLAATEQATRIVTERVARELETGILAKAQIESDAALAQYRSSADAAFNEFQKHLADLLKDPRIATGVGQSVGFSHIEGFAFYGHQRLDGTWDQLYFREASGDPKGFPSAGDVVIATGYVYARQGYISSVPSQGWVNAPLEPRLGVIRPKDKLRVLGGMTIHDGFVWIKFQRI